MRLLIIIIGFTLSVLSCSSDIPLQWYQENGYRWAELYPGSKDTGFEQLSPSATGIDMINALTDQLISDNQNLLNGSGVAAGDVDGDGLVDLYFARLDGPNKLYRNMGGMEFEDITQQAGVGHAGHRSTGVALADVDGDADLDLLVAALEGHTSLYLNDGSGDFTLNEQSGLKAGGGSTTLALSDIDGDGDLDLYVAKYKEKTVKDMFNMKELSWENTVRRQNGEYVLRPPFNEHFELIPRSGQARPDRRELGSRDALYINNGDGSFSKADPAERFRTHQGEPAGLQRDWGLTAAFHDLNADGLPDLYVCNDFWTPDRIWINQGGGVFHATDPMTLRKQSFSSMGMDVSDINRDGHVDFFVTEMLAARHQQRMRQMITYTPFTDKINDADSQPQYMQNTMHLNRGDQTYAEIAAYSGIEATGWSWATTFMDADLDGYEDLFINTGHAHDVLDLDTQRELSQQSAEGAGRTKGYILQYPSLRLPNATLQNNGDLTFTDKAEDWGVSGEDISHGMAMADLDNDGDLDMVNSRLGQPPSMFENLTSAARLAVRLKGTTPNTQAIGANVELQGGPVRQQKEITSGGNYLSGSDPQVMFAASPENVNHRLRITWPSGDQTELDSLQANRIYEINQADVPVHQRSDPKQNSTASSEPPLFKDVSDRVGYVHDEQPFNDFEIQPLLPLRLSQLGPGVGWIDYDRDGDDDLLVGTGKGGRAGLFENNDGQFQRVDLGELTGTAATDQTGIVGWPQGEAVQIVIGSSHYEQESTGSGGFIYSIKNGSVAEQELPGTFSTTGPLAAADYDGDGDIDLFVGGRFVPTQYPVNASSRLFTSEDGQFSLDERNSEPLKNMGLVTGAAFTDYDKDGDPDLLVSTEWGSLRLFRNVEGTFREITRSADLDLHKGWWNGVATGDFNNDGWPDIVATNRGANIQTNIWPDHPARIYHDDFDRDQKVEIIEAQYDQFIGDYVPQRSLDELYSPLPAITGNVRSYKHYGEMSLTDLLGVPLQRVPSKSVNTVRQMLFLSQDDGQRFTARPLPTEAQFTTAFATAVADANNDGNEDIFLTQNLFAVPQFVARQDAGRGLWLLGDGGGGFEPMSGRASGVKVYGEQRGAALSDVNSDGKVDLALAQNEGPLKLYLNQTERPGITVELQGPPQNPAGIGASIRLIYADGSEGPLREVQAGSGYWSQHSPTQILGTDSTKHAARIEVIWPNGTRELVEIDSSKDIYQVRM